MLHRVFTFLGLLPMAAMSLSLEQCPQDASKRLVKAAENQNVEELSRLLACPGIDVNAVEMDWTALQRAAYEGCEAIARELVARPDTDVNAADSAGWSALMFAAAQGKQDVAALLLGRPDIDVNAQGARGRASSPNWMHCIHTPQPKPSISSGHNQ